MELQLLMHLIQRSLGQKTIKIVDFHMKIVYALTNIPEEKQRARMPRTAQLINYYLQNKTVNHVFIKFV